MPNSFSQSDLNKNKYLPPDIAQSMNQHFQNNMPAHLKQYLSSITTGYVPRGMQDSIAKELKRNLPDHLKGYSDAYVEQSIMNPMIKSHSQPSHVNLAAKPPIPSQLRRDHSMPVGEQHTVELNTLPVAAKQMFANESPQSQPGVTQSPYDFIMNPEVKKSKTPLPGLPGLPASMNKLLIGLGLVFVLIIFIVVISSLIKGTSNTPALTSVLQDQTEIIHIATNASDVSSLSSSYKNFIATTQVSLGSASNQLTNYLTINGVKVSPAALTLKESSSTDQTLATANSNGDYSQVFDQVMTTELTTYVTDLSNANKEIKGVHGKALLRNFFDQEELLYTQLSQASSSQ